MLRIRIFIVVLCGALCTSSALAADHAFRIDQLFSNADGSVQYVILRETAGLDGQNVFVGQTLTATQQGRANTFAFPANLPSSVTAKHAVLIATQGYVAAGSSAPEFAAVEPDYIVSDRFLPTVAGSVNFAGISEMSYDVLPGDGFSALYQTGEVKDNAVQNFRGSSARLPMLQVNVVEYYNATLDHYFISDLAADIDALDSGRIAGWTRTGQSFKVWPATNGFLNPVCRFYIPPQHGNSHFFSGIASECADVLARTSTDPNFSGYVLERSDAFYVAAPFSDGVCAYLWIPVYRLWNARADSNHRYTTSSAIKAQMIARGYVAEGIGPDAVAMCSPNYN